MYTAMAYQKRLDQLAMDASMCRRGNCWDEAVAESTNGTIKAELLAEWTPATRSIATHPLFPYIEGSCDTNRPHPSPGHCPPIEIEFALSNKLEQRIEVVHGSRLSSFPTFPLAGGAASRMSTAPVTSRPIRLCSRSIERRPALANCPFPEAGAAPRKCVDTQQARLHP